MGIEPLLHHFQGLIAGSGSLSYLPSFGYNRFTIRFSSCQEY